MYSFACFVCVYMRALFSSRLCRVSVFDGTSFSDMYSRACLFVYCKLIMFAQIYIRRYARLKCVCACACVRHLNCLTIVGNRALAFALHLSATPAFLSILSSTLLTVHRCSDSVDIIHLF